MGVVVGVSGVWWRVFQWRVAVVVASSMVPGVLVWFGVVFGVGWLVPGVCACVGWLASVGVSVVCVLWWFRMLTCLASFFFLFLSFVLSCCLVNNGLPGCVGAGGCLLVGCLGWCGCFLGLVGGVCLCVWAGACVLWAGESVFVCLLGVIGLLLLACWSRVVCVWGYWLLSFL